MILLKLYKILSLLSWYEEQLRLLKIDKHHINMKMEVKSFLILNFKQLSYHENVDIFRKILFCTYDFFLE